jgi:hypothetical protein
MNMDNSTDTNLEHSSSPPRGARKGDGYSPAAQSKPDPACEVGGHGRTSLDDPISSPDGQGPKVDLSAAEVTDDLLIPITLKPARPGRSSRSPSAVRSDNPWGYKGVSLVNRPWRACITRRGRTHSLGTFSTAAEAALAYNLAAALLDRDEGASGNLIHPEDEPDPEAAESIRHAVGRLLGITIPKSNRILQPKAKAAEVEHED